MDSSPKPIGRGRPLVSAFLAVVLAWTASLAIISHGLFYGVGDDFHVSGRIKLFMAVPMALTAVSFEAVRLRRSSRVVWLATALLVMFALPYLLFFILVFNVGLLLFPSAFFLFLAASKMSIEEGPTRNPQQLIPIEYTTDWTRLNGFSRRRIEPGE